VIRALTRYGTLGAGLPIAALREPQRNGIVDERGGLTFEELDRRSNAIANRWHALGAGAGTGVGILCRNHRGFLDATFASAKIGGRAVLLNTDFAGPQLREVCEREGVEVLVHDEEFTQIAREAPVRRGRFVAFVDATADAETLDDLITDGDPSPPPPAGERGRVILLTSGTTGTPKGAPREQGASLAPLGALLSKVPLRAAETTYIAPPMFHALGFAHTVLAIGLGSTIVTRRRFKAEEALAGVAEHRCSALIVVPAQLQRILALGEDAIRAHDLSALRIVFVSGSLL
jgi:fatty-acyl-CoA synthase